ncbi:hypothetical protein DUI87_01011 [Hirundo rustica rustica]|uniref:Integrase-type domain-containing protein n=1 Tax=Hirundo rustica rustica TaxID=333673 RepID=A0A3M0L422_HIRRU|nr:hypothetical protein DUI87_01011 [Hirundo rustica rustica]
MWERETSGKPLPCKKQCEWKNSVGKLQKERKSSTCDDTSNGDDSRTGSARGTIIGEQQSSALSRTISRIPYDPELLPPGAQSDRNDELTVLAKPHQPPLIIPPNTSITRAIALPPHAAEQVLPVLREQDPPSGIELQVKKEGAQEQVLEEMALADANERCKAAILSLSIEPAPTLHDMLQQKSPDVIVKDPATRETKSPHDLVTWGHGYAYVSTPPGLKWVPAEWVKPFIPKTARPPAEALQVASAAWRRRKRRTFSF